DFLKWLEDESIAGVLFLSGDRHHSVLMHTHGEKGYAYWELTCSPLTAGTFPARQEDLNNPMTQPGTLVTQRNFCAIHVEGAAKDRRLRLQVRASDGALLWERALKVTQAFQILPLSGHSACSLKPCFEFSRPEERRYLLQCKPSFWA
ncbi:MAG: hypothetical protein EBT59_12445, partial [Betaproteobacteria bacterium]|nr:hypothetical protein [Betaproteobacteria bacterium]